jgi:hypothetical protein
MTAQCSAPPSEPELLREIKTWRPDLPVMICMDRLPFASEGVLSEVADMYPA